MHKITGTITSFEPGCPIHPGGAGGCPRCIVNGKLAERGMRLAQEGEPFALVRLWDGREHVVIHAAHAAPTPDNLRSADLAVAEQLDRKGMRLAKDDEPSVPVLVFHPYKHTIEVRASLKAISSSPERQDRIDRAAPWQAVEEAPGAVEAAASPRVLLGEPTSPYPYSHDVSRRCRAQRLFAAQQTGRPVQDAACPDCGDAVGSVTREDCPTCHGAGYVSCVAVVTPQPPCVADAAANRKS